MPSPTRWDRISALIRLCLWTGAVADQRSESIVLIGPPSHGKTALLKRVAGSRTVDVFTDATVTALIESAKRAQLGQVTHVIFYELQKLLMRRSSVGEQAMGFLASATEEGLESMQWGGRWIDFKGTQFGMLAAITPDAMQHFQDRLHHIGLPTRGLWIDWSLTPEEIAGVNLAISKGDGRALTPTPITFRSRSKVRVRMSGKVSKMALDLADKLLPNDIRFHKQVIGLVRASAVERGRDRANARDVERVGSFKDFFHKMRRS